MDPDREKPEEFSDTEDPLSLKVDDEEEERSGDEDEEEEQDENIFNAWVLRYRARDHQERPEEEEVREEEPQTKQSDSGSSMESPIQMRPERRASLPCPVRDHREAT